MNKNDQIDYRKLKAACYNRVFLPKKNPNLSYYQCSLNRGVLNDPFIDQKLHRFCKICIQSYLQQSKNCPIDFKDRHKIKKQTLKSDKQSRILVQNLKCLCENSEQGCQYTFYLKDYMQYQQHKLNCPKQYIPCTQKNCTSKFYREDIQLHKQRCLYYIVKCKNCDFFSPRVQLQKHQEICGQWILNCININCRSSLKRKQMTQHVRLFCPQTQIRCIKKRCNIKFLRKQEKQHNKICQYSDQICEYCRQVTYEKFDKNSHQEICNEYPLKCQHKGCDKKIERRSYIYHINQLCGMKQLICPSEDCNKKIFLKDQKNHLEVCENYKIYCNYCKIQIKRKLMQHHLNGCNNFPIQCNNQQKCRIVIIRCKRERHIQLDCEYALIKCTNNSCNYLCLRKDIQIHLRNCQYRLQPCRFCKIKIPFVAIQQHIKMQCQDHKIPCYQNCKVQVARKLMKKHIQQDCFQSIISCQYIQYNCKNTFQRKFLQKHQQQFLKHHHTLVLAYIFKVMQDIKVMRSKQSLMEAEITQLKNMIGINTLISNKILETEKKIEVTIQINKNAKISEDYNQKIISEQRFRSKQLDRMQQYQMQGRKQMNNLQNMILGVSISINEFNSHVGKLQQESGNMRFNLNNIQNKFRNGNFNNDN